MNQPPYAILVVEDSPEDAETLRRYLQGDQDRRYAITSAATAAEALNCCREQQYDLLLIDYYLPDDNGVALLDSFIREHGPYVSAVVFTTGMHNEALVSGAVQLGAHDYVIKNLTDFAVSLRHAIVNALGKLQMQRQLAQQQRELVASNRVLQQMVQELAADRRQLTARVAERTTELHRANRAMGDALRLRDTFLAQMSHELRTPLGAVLSCTEALLDGVYGPISEGQGRSLVAIEQSAQHLLALINDILDVSKIAAGKLELELAEVEIWQLCQQSIDMVDTAARQKGISVGIAIDSVVTQLRVDERRARQILLNLLSNAIKFTPAGGQVGLQVIGDPLTQTASLTVWDTGVGIAERDLAQLFQPFVQIRNELSGRQPGTGLGLALVRQLAEAHGGSVTVESEPGRGSRFCVTLPWQAGAGGPG